MILDKNLQFAAAQSVAHAAGTILVGDVLDTVVARNVGEGQPVYLVITVDTAVITGGAAGTIEFQLVSDAQAAIATDGSATVHLTTKNFVTGAAAAEDLVAGAIAYVCALPSASELNKYEEFLGILAIVATTTTTAGKINAFLTLDPHGIKPLAAAGI